jgi:toxin ParE1/3/4
MNYTIVFNKGAMSDYHEACQWYFEKSPAVETRFKKALDLRLQDISKNPQSFGIRFIGLRAAPIPKFPYLIFYEIEDIFQRVSVIALWHEARDRNVLKKRI